MVFDASTSHLAKYLSRGYRLIKILHRLGLVSLSCNYLQSLLHPGWCRISEYSTSKVSKCLMLGLFVCLECILGNLPRRGWDPTNIRLEEFVLREQLANWKKFQHTLGRCFGNGRPWWQWQSICTSSSGRQDMVRLQDISRHGSIARPQYAAWFATLTTVNALGRIHDLWKHLPSAFNTWVHLDIQYTLISLNIPCYPSLGLFLSVV